MINVAGVLLRITNDGGTDVNPSGIATLADLSYPTLVLSASAGKVDTLYAHYAFRFPKSYNDRVTADSGTFIEGRATDVVQSLRVLDLLKECSLLVTCDAGKASVLYAIENLGLLNSTLDEATAQAFTAESDFLVQGVPDLVAERPTPGADIDLTITNGGVADANYYRADGVLANFTLLATETPTADYAYTDATVLELVDYKYKASFVVTGTRNGISRTVEGRKCSPVYVIAENSTVI